MVFVSQYDTRVRTVMIDQKMIPEVLLSELDGIVGDVPSAKF